MAKSDRLDPDKIKVNLKTRLIGREILVYDCTSSTNDVAGEYAKNKDNDGLVIFTEEQFAGRGRAGNKWITGRGDSIICSIVLSNCKCSAELLTLTCAVATAEAIGYNAKIKWPNDIFLNGKKTAGILLESRTDNSHISYIVGIGINCHQKTFPAELQPIATSIDIETKTISDRISLAKRLLTSMDHWLKISEKTGAKVTACWRKLSVQLGHRITVIFDGKNLPETALE